MAREVYDLSAESQVDLGNIATRGPVLSGDDILIGIRCPGLSSEPIAADSCRGIVLRQESQCVAGSTLELRNAQGALITSNNNGKIVPGRAIQASGLAPKKPKESAILRTLAPGPYTALLRGASGTGLGLVEVYNLGNE